MDSTEPLHKLCAKCSESLFPKDKPRGSVKMCHGHCQPRKAFHYACIGEKFRTMIKYECQVCDPCNWEEGCYSCGGPTNTNVVVCINNPRTGCPRFLHDICLPGGMNNYNCGLCTLNISQFIKKKKNSMNSFQMYLLIKIMAYKSLFI